MFKFVLFFFTPLLRPSGRGALSPLFIFRLSRVYHRTVFTALHFFARPHTIYSVCCAGNEDDTDSISGNVDSSEAHSDPFSSRITGGAVTESPQSASTTLHDENCGPKSEPPPRPSLT